MRLTIPKIEIDSNYPWERGTENWAEGKRWRRHLLFSSYNLKFEYMNILSIQK